MNRIKKGDRVVVTAGKDKGKQGDVVRVMGDKVVVSNINIVKRHTKPNPQANQPGGVHEREAPIHVSNRTEDRRVGKEGVSSCRSQWWTELEKKTKNTLHQ